MGKIASVLLKDDPLYGRSHFVEGLKQAGYTVSFEAQSHPMASDVLILWNRLSTTDHIASRYEQERATVLIAEHGWIGNDTYALSRSFHNGAGTWRVGPEDRWQSFGIEVKPWRESGEHVLVLPQRGMGTFGVAMPQGWTKDVTERLAKITNRPIKVRYPVQRWTPLDPDFEHCHCVVTWGSGAAIKALVAGIPVFYEMPNWIGSLAGHYLPYCGSIEDVNLDEWCRREMLHQLAWAMWKPAELSSGSPFKWLLS